MNCNLKNKIIALVACTFATTAALNSVGYAEETVISPEPAVVADKTANDDLLGLEDITAPEAAAPVAVAPKSDNLDFLNEESPKEPTADDVAVAPKPLLDVQPLDEETESKDDGEATSADNNEPVIPETEAPKSPFENFGNAILSKVDSDLFNQMSNIEKQTTLLKLELRREELKNRVEALRVARIRAQLEESDRQKAAREKIKNEEAERQSQILNEQKKLKEKEIELEKVKQAKLLNDYMNEMLVVNQSWVEKNTKLLSRVKELEEERTNIINDAKTKIGSFQAMVQELQTKADTAAAIYQRNLDNLNSQISQMRDSMLENENVIQQMRDGANPFAENVPSKDAIDMSQEYAIMDITGKGDDVVAKIVSHDGTTFTVHKGSMLKNGEVVTAITDHYIAFENNGVQSYLYTSGTVREYEPTVSFNGASKTSWEGSSEEDSGELSRKSGGPISFGNGMFIQ